MTRKTHRSIAVAALVALAAVTGAAAGLQDTAEPSPSTQEPERRAVPRQGEPVRRPPATSPRTAEPRSGTGDDERRAQPRPPAEPRRPARPPAPPRPTAPRRQVIFIGGYFYDPFFGPYPWWPHTAYPRRYYPVYDVRAEMRVIARPREAAVYVDGFYAGVVDDFDGVFQALPLPPGGHTITLHLPRHRTAHFNVYLHPGATFRLHHTMEVLPAGAGSEPPPLAPPVPPPPAGSYEPPRTQQPVPPTPSSPATVNETAERGTLELRVQPLQATVSVDGESWMSSDPGAYVIELPAGGRRLDVSLHGYRALSTLVEIRAGESTPLNVVLAPD